MPRESKWRYFEDQYLALNLETTVYYAIKSFAHLHIRNLNKSTRIKETSLEKLPNFKKALRERDRLIQLHLAKHQQGSPSPAKAITVGQVIDEIYATAKDRKPLRAKTIAKRKFYFDRLRKELDLENFPIALLTAPVWTVRLDKVRARRNRDTYWDYVKHANIVIRHAYERKYISHYITLKNPDPPHKEGVVFSTEELGWMWDEMGEETRDQFVLSYENGMRKLEALHLEWDRINLETGEVVFRKEHVKTGSKTNKGRTIFITSHALERLRARRQRQLAYGYTGQWVFPAESWNGPVDDNKTAWKAIKRRVRKGNAKMGRPPRPQFQDWGTWHGLRHTAISRMLLVAKMPIALVSEFVGTSIATLQRVYLHSQAEHTRGVADSLMIEPPETPTQD